jgi:ubiquitin-like protein Pup
MEQQFKRSSRSDDPPEPIDPPSTPPPPPAAIADLGTLLDDLDDVLEADALTFVSRFVQQGGQ